MSQHFEHYLSYGSTDQQTVRELTASFNGLLVPGTIAAFQAEGTKGFVLSLSARSSEPYMIDSRFPLFQNFLPTPKKSHTMLADVLGITHLLGSQGPPRPADFTRNFVDTIAENWIRFNIGFDQVKTKTFDKYAARLGEEVFPKDRRGPNVILPPYVMVGREDDGWATVSDSLWEASQRASVLQGSTVPLWRVIAAESAQLWARLSAQSEASKIAAWINNLDEFATSSETELVEYGLALKAAKHRGQSVFALYGGFFAVLLERHGLGGASHGIGFGEHRQFLELKSSGAPPARYYVPKLHKYLPVEVAQALWDQFQELVACNCEECNGSPPISLQYHELMKHSVRARQREINEWVDLPTHIVIGRLENDFRDVQSAVSQLRAPERVLKRAQASYSHLSMWARVLRTIEDAAK